MNKWMRPVLFVLLLALTLAPASLGFDVVEPSSGFYAADYADVLSQETEDYIINCNNSLFAQTGAQLVVVTIDFLNGTDIESYSTKLFNQWKIGDEEKQNGLLVLLAVGEQDYWATQGSGVSAAGLTGSLIDDYLNNYLEPDFKEARYDAGVRKLFDALIDWYERYYSITVEALPTELLAPAGMETLPTVEESELDELENEDHFEENRQLIGKIAGIFLIVVLAAAAAAALLVIIPRYIALRRQGYRYSIFNRAFWSKRHRPPPPSSVRHTTQTSARTRTSDAQQSSQTREDRANQRGGFGSGTGLRNRH